MPTADTSVTGLVLSGGGARTSFQIGALRYLYDRVGITPSVITGTSAGSILATVLAQSADHEGQRRSLDQLERLVREMEDSSDMFEELPWFTRLRERGPVWIQALEARKRRQGTLGRSFKRVADLRQGISTAAERVTRSANGAGDPTGETAADDTGPAGGTRGPADDDAARGTARHRAARGTARHDAGRRPAHAAPEDALVTDAAAGTAPPSRLTPASSAAPAETPAPETPAPEPAWAPARLLESIDMVRTVGRASADLETIVQGAQRERSMYRPGPFVDRILDPEVFRRAAVAESGVTLRVAVVGLESGELRYVTETGALVDRENRPLPDEGPVDIVEAVRASCAIPTVFPPVRLGSENYVDGGVRESLPAEVALTHLGVDRCYAVVAGPSGVARERSFDDKDMFAIVMRTTTAIMTDEVQRDEVGRAKEAGAVVVEPEFDVHDTLTVEPGLVAIAIDYGYLRAAEAHERASAEEQAVTRDAILLRRRIWAAEERAFADEALTDEQRLQQVAEIAGLKFELRDLLARIPASRLPEGAGDWWRGWERHAFDIPVTPSWALPRR